MYSLVDFTCVRFLQEIKVLVSGGIYRNRMEYTGGVVVGTLAVSKGVYMGRIYQFSPWGRGERTRGSERSIERLGVGGRPLGVGRIHANVRERLYQLVYTDTGRSRLTFRPLARCSRGVFINSSVLIPWIDEWPPIAILCAPHTLPQYKFSLGSSLYFFSFHFPFSRHTYFSLFSTMEHSYSLVIL